MQSEFLECKPCAKKFTGRECLEQHLASAKHIKKIRAMGIQPELVNRNYHPGEVSSSDNVECPSKYVAAADSSGNEQIQNFADSTNKETENEYPCNYCKLSFSKIPDFLGHIQSKSHIEVVHQNLLSTCFVPSSNISPTVSSASAVQMIFPASIGNNFKCDICDVVCNREEQYTIHLAGAKHKKKTSTKEREIAGLPLGVVVNQSTLDNMIFCEICEIPCSGTVSYEQHLRGEKHRKRLEKSKQYKPKVSFSMSGIPSTNKKLDKEVLLITLNSDDSSDEEGSRSAMDWKSSSSDTSEQSSTRHPYGIRDILYTSPQNFDNIIREKLEKHDVAVIGIDDPVVL